MRCRRNVQAVCSCRSPASAAPEAGSRGARRRDLGLGREGAQQLTTFRHVLTRRGRRQAILMDVHAFASLAQVRILLVPVGNITPQAFESYAAEIRSFEQIRLGDISADSKDERGA